MVWSLQDTQQSSSRGREFMKALKSPVTYQGGKARLAPIILDTIKPTGAFWDVCCGSGAVTLALLDRGFPPSQITMVEAGPWGAFWEAICTGAFDMERFKEIVGTIPSERERIQQWMNDTAAAQIEDSDVPYVYILLQAGAYGGKAIDRVNGEWKNTNFRRFWQPTATSKRRSVVNPMMPMPQSIEERVRSLVSDNRLREVKVLYCDAMETSPKNATVYIDPPYEGTYKYNSRTLDLEAFRVRAQQSGCSVWVSEAKPLSGGESVCLSEGRMKGGISGSTSRKPNEEHLTRFRAEAQGGRVKQVQSTSLEAYEASKPRVSEMEARIVAYLQDRGSEGATDEEMDIAFGTEATRSNRPTRNALTKRGQVVNTGTKRKTKSGRRAIVWALQQYAEPSVTEPAQKPLGASPRGDATAYAAWALESLTGHQQALTWRVDLRRDVGTPDAIGDEDGYHDQRWTQAIARLKQALQDHQGHPQARTQLILLIDCMVGVEQGVPHPVRVDLSTPKDVIVALLSSYPPPYGKWQLRSSEVLHSEYRVSTPETYFIDGIPF